MEKKLVDTILNHMTEEESSEFISNQIKIQRNTIEIQRLQLEALKSQIETQKIAKDLANKSLYPTQNDFNKELMLRIVQGLVTSRKSDTCDAMKDSMYLDNLIYKYYMASKKGISVTLNGIGEKWYE